MRRRGVECRSEADFPDAGRGRGTGRGISPRRREHPHGRASRQGQLRARRGAAGAGHAAGAHATGAFAVHADSDAGGGGSELQRGAAGRLPERLWVDCVLASNVDDTLAPAGRHMLTCFVQYLPYRLRERSWDVQRERLGDTVTEIIGEYAPNVPASVIARCVLAPPDLEARFGITEGNIFHGDIVARTDVLHAAVARLGELPYADREPVPVRGRHASRRRRHRCARLQCRPPHPRGLVAAACAAVTSRCYSK